MEHRSTTFISGLLFRIKFKESLLSHWYVPVLWLCVCLHTILTDMFAFAYIFTCHIYFKRDISDSETVKFSKATAWLYTSSITLKKYGCLSDDLTCLGETEAAVYTIKWHSLPRVNQRNVVHLWLWICNLTESLTLLIISCSLHTKFLCVLEIKCWCKSDPPPLLSPKVFHKQKEQKFQFYTYSPQIITNLKIILEKNKITLLNKSGG